MSETRNSAEPCYRLWGSMGDGSCEALSVFVTCVNCPDFARVGQTLFSRAPDPETLDAWTAAVARPPAVRDREGKGHLVFTVAGQALAISVARLYRVFPPRTIHSVPGRAQTPLLGVVNLEGELTACLCLAHVLGLNRKKDRTRAQESRLVCLRADLCDFAFPVEELLGVRRISLHNLAPAPALVELAEHPLVRGIAVVEGSHIAVMNGDELVRLAGNILR